MTEAIRPAKQRVLVPVLALVSVIAIAFVVAPIIQRHPSAKHQDDAPFGAYAGYLWPGRVSSMRGAWSVPTIATGSRTGFGTTWIGVHGSTKVGAFIQVGTAELRADSHDQTAGNRYWAFWSDTAHHFHPVFLFSTQPRDDVTATLARARTGWFITIVDETSHRQARFATAEEGAAPFADAQWAQEDPVDSTGARYAYPSLPAVEFSRLEVNGAPPSFSSVYSSWMSVNDVDLAPTELTHDGFRLHAAKPTPDGVRYLRTSDRWINAARSFGAIFERRAQPSGAEVLAASTRFSAAMRQGIRSLGSTPLPASTRRPVSSVIRALRSLEEQAQASPGRGVGGLVSWRSSLAAAWNALFEREHRVRRALGIPEFTPRSRL